MLIEPILDLERSDCATHTLGEVCARGAGSIQTGPFGSQLHASDYVFDGIPSVMPQDLGDNRISTDHIARIRPADLKRLARYALEEGDIVCSRRGDVTRRSLVRQEEAGWLCGTGCLRVRLGVGPVRADYLAQYFAHPYVRDWLVRHAVGGTMPNLNTAILGALPISYPPEPQQRAVTTLLGSIDDKIDLNRRANQTLEEMVSALFRSWFVDFDPVMAKAAGRQPFTMDAATAALCPSSFEESELGSIPRGWRVRPLSEIARHHRETVNPLRYPSEPFLHFSIPAFDGGRLPVRELGSAIKSNKSVVPSGAVLISKLNPHIPRVWLVDDTESDVRRIASTEFLVLTPASGRTREFLFGLCGSDDFLDEFKGYVTGTSNSHQRVQSGAVAGLPVVVPSKEIEQAYTAAVGPMHVLMLANLRESRILAALRDTLLPKLLTGEIRLNDAEREVERAL